MVPVLSDEDIPATQPLLVSTLTKDEETRQDAESAQLVPSDDASTTEMTDAEIAAEQAAADKKNKEKQKQQQYERNTKEVTTGAAWAMAEKQQAQKQIDAILAKGQVDFVPFKATLTAKGKSTCHDVFRVLDEHPTMSMLVEGHTNCGTPCAAECKNSKLAEDRCASVVEVLIMTGATNDFQTRAWGCKHPQIGCTAAVIIYPQES